MTTQLDTDIANPEKEYSLYFLEPGMASAVAADIAALHAEMLPHSPVVLLGMPFMQRFYYAVLPRENLICGAVAYYRDTPVGFIVATHDPASFMSKALHRHWGKLALLVARSLITQPGSISGLWEALQIMRHLPKPKNLSNVGELLSFGVLPEYAKRKFVKHTGLHISMDLQNAVEQQLRLLGTRRLRSLVDQDNTVARLFYTGLGWHQESGLVPGWKQPVVQYYKLLDAPEA
ncbi:MAG: hypothetical protein OET44_19840 [Gammaproteobacteria bacterium]|nr:hypothetical protein [Gammaproteobacteria bacterium]